MRGMTSRLVHVTIWVRRKGRKSESRCTRAANSIYITIGEARRVKRPTLFGLRATKHKSRRSLLFTDHCRVVMAVWLIHPAAPSNLLQSHAPSTLLASEPFSFFRIRAACWLQRESYCRLGKEVLRGLLQPWSSGVGR
jgi:hypothetical protein